MGLFNVIKLANDYAKAKKVLAQKKIDIKKAKEFIDLLYKYKDELSTYIRDIKDILKRLKEVTE